MERQLSENGLDGLQEMLFMLIRGLIWSLPLGILAFAEQLTAQASGGVMLDTIGKYVAVVVGGNFMQMIIVLPLFLLARGLKSHQNFQSYVSRRAYGALHKEFGGHPSCNDAKRGDKAWGESQNLKIRTPPVHNHQYERMRRFYCRDIIICASEWRNGCRFFRNSHMGFNSCDIGNRKRRRSDGMLFPNTFSDDGHGSASGCNGYNIARIYHNRYDRNCRKCLVRLMRMRDDSP